MSKFEVGMKVAVFGSNGKFERYDTVRKVYKGGNVVLEGYIPQWKKDEGKTSKSDIVGNTQQYHPYGGDYASATGSYSWRSGSIRIVNNETRERIEEEARKAKLIRTRKAVSKLIDTKGFTQDQYDRVMLILKEENTNDA